MHLIGLNGGYGVGKSTAIELLEQTMREQGDNRPVKLVKFAGVLYEFQEMLYNRIESAYQRPPGFVKDRKLLQWLGTEWGRGLDENLWVTLWLNETKAALKAGMVVVCDDVRFDNEAKLLKALGGTLIKIVRDDGAKHAQGGTGIANHASEAGVNDSYLDYIVENNSSLQDYKNSLAYLYRKFGVASDSREYFPA